MRAHVVASGRSARRISTRSAIVGRGASEGRPDAVAEAEINGTLDAMIARRRRADRRDAESDAPRCPAPTACAFISQEPESCAPIPQKVLRSGRRRCGRPMTPTVRSPPSTRPITANGVFHVSRPALRRSGRVQRRDQVTRQRAKIAAPGPSYAKELDLGAMAELVAGGRALGGTCDSKGDSPAPSRVDIQSHRVRPRRSARPRRSTLELSKASRLGRGGFRVELTRSSPRVAVGSRRLDRHHRPEHSRRRWFAHGGARVARRRRAASKDSARAPEGGHHGACATPPDRSRRVCSPSWCPQAERVSWHPQRGSLRLTGTWPHLTEDRVG